MILETVFTLLAIYKPLHIMNTPEKTCGASERFLKENIRLDVSPRRIRVNQSGGKSGQGGLVEWDLVGQDEDGDWVARYQVREDQYMSMELTFNTGGAYLSIQGIDKNREPCRDMVYLKRVR